jgi:hypothetical protein
MQVLSYWKANWLPLVSGIVIAAIVVPIVKSAARQLLKMTSGASKRIGSLVQESRRALRRRRAAQGRFVGRLTIADMKAVLKSTPAERLHPVYQDEMKKLAETVRGFTFTLPTFKLPGT